MCHSYLEKVEFSPPSGDTEHLAHRSLHLLTQTRCRYHFAQLGNVNRTSMDRSDCAKKHSSRGLRRLRAPVCDLPPRQTDPVYILSKVFVFESYGPGSLRGQRRPFSIWSMIPAQIRTFEPSRDPRKARFSGSFSASLVVLGLF
jgi:hypothetical protein